MSKTGQLTSRKIHVSLPEDIHRKLRIKCALDDTSIQQYVSRLVADSVEGVVVRDENGSRRS